MTFVVVGPDTGPTRRGLGRPEPLGLLLAEHLLKVGPRNALLNGALGVDSVQDSRLRVVMDRHESVGTLTCKRLRGIQSGVPSGKPPQNLRRHPVGHDDVSCRPATLDKRLQGSDREAKRPKQDPEGRPHDG